MKLFGVVIVALPYALAFPSAFNGVLQDDAVKLEARQASCPSIVTCGQVYQPIPDSDIKTNPTAVQASIRRPNCGSGSSCTTFDPREQYVSTTGNHAFQFASPSDIRGPCPALNAAANHGYIARNGISNINEVVEGMLELYGLGQDVSSFLATFATVYQGDTMTQTFSIGGPQPNTGSDTSAPAQGLSYSHSVFESDASVARCDAYLNRGDSHALSSLRYRYLIESGRGNNRYTLDRVAKTLAKNTMRSVLENPYYYAPLFAGTFFVPTTYSFAIALFSNHTVKNPRGYLDAGILKLFFGMDGTRPNNTWKPGQERIPDNWYRRPAQAPYDMSLVFNDLKASFAAYPDTLRFGGNSNGVNTYNPSGFSDYSRDYVTDDNILQGNNFACLVYNSILQSAPLYRPALSDDDITLLGSATNQSFAVFNCPQPQQDFNDGIRQRYPGMSYHPTGPAQNC